jgi:hypothetical protein
MSIAKLQRAFRLYLKIARLSTYCAVVGIVAATLIARSVYASVTETVFELNREWSRQAGTLDRPSYAVRLNGQTMNVSSHMVDESVDAVLQTAEDECRAHSGHLEGDIAKLPGVAMATLTSWVFGVVRRQWSDRGYVACIERDGDNGVAGLATDLGDLAKTGDLAKVGSFRYVLVDRGPGATKTHVLRQWTTGEFNLVQMFPALGDAPGSDLAEAPRPEGARRVLDASVDGSPFGVRVYDAPGRPESILARYEQDLVAKGWTSVAMPEKDAPKMRVFDLGASDLFITATRVGDRSVVSIADMPPSISK